MTKIVSTQSQVKANVLRYTAFIGDEQNLHDRLSKHRAWYAVRDNGKWFFGNSKIVGYEGLTPKKYLSENHDGRQTEAVLSKWFSELESDDPLYEEVWSALTEFLADYGKTPSKLARISVLGSEITSDENPTQQAISDLIVVAARELDKDRLKSVRKRLKALL